MIIVVVVLSIASPEERFILEKFCDGFPVSILEFRVRSCLFLRLDLVLLAEIFFVEVLDIFSLLSDVLAA